ncbi:hypothetical protein HYQ46_000278 [Verticillium longisporum]|nr:hypothetical protein HYQ46_000278 [Verticillium longisporum]
MGPSDQDLDKVPVPLVETRRALGVGDLLAVGFVHVWFPSVSPDVPLPPVASYRVKEARSETKDSRALVPPSMSTKVLDNDHSQASSLGQVEEFF